MNRLRFAHKFLLIAVVFLLPMLSVSALLFHLLSADIVFGQAELRGIGALSSIEDLQNAVQAHRGAVAMQLAGIESNTGKIAASDERADAAIRAIDDWAAGDGKGLLPATRWAAIKSTWALLGARGAEVEEHRSFQEHTALVEQIIAFTGDIADASNLSLDSSLSSYAMVDFTTQRAPAALESIGLVRNFASTHFRQGDRPLSINLGRLLAYEGALDTVFSPLPAALQRTLNSDSHAAAVLGPKLKIAIEAEEQLKKQIDDNIVDADVVAIDTRTLFEVGRVAKDALVDLAKSTLPELRREIAARVDVAEHQRVIAMNAWAAATLVALYLYSGFVRSLRKSMHIISASARKLAQGEFPDRIEMASRDELKEIADEIEVVSHSLKSKGEHLRKTLALQTAILNSSNLGIIATDTQGAILSVNPAAQRMLGYSGDELIGLKSPEAVHDRDELCAYAQSLSARLGAVVAVGFETLVAKARLGIEAVDEQEWTYIRKDGHRLPVSVSITATHDLSGSLTGFLSVAHDITERRHKDQMIARSLKEKDTLLKEVYHRVKNNLQVVSSLFDLQLRQLPEGAARFALSDSADRVRAMALVHEKLYQSGTLSSISLLSYIGELSDRLSTASAADQRGIELITSIDAIEVGMDTAVPLGLWLNEVVSNSLKHGFPDGRKGTIRISATRSAANDVNITIADDGVGLLPAAPRRSASLGMKLIESLSEQLDGDYSIESNAGVCVRLRFPLRQAA